MNRLQSRSLPMPPPAPAAPDAAQAVVRLRRVHRAASDLRRGIPVVLTGEDAMIAVLAAESAGADNVAELTALAAEPLLLLLAPTRAAAALRRPVAHGEAAVAVHVPESLLVPEALRAIAEPSAQPIHPDRLGDPAPLPPMAATALTLGKLALLLPAVLVAVLRPNLQGELEHRHLLVLPAADVADYPGSAAAALRQVAAARVPLADAPDARVIAFRSEGAGLDHLAIVVGEPEKAAAPLVRIHSECFTGDLLGSLRCDCGEQLRGAIRRMAEEGAGVLLYLAQEGRGIGLINKLRAYTLQDRGLDTLDANRALGWDADERNFMIAARMLEALGLRRIRLLTNNPDKLTALAACGVEIAGREAHSFAPNGINDEYLATKAARFGHLLD
ncbi:MAG TPA: GTP cyclohydrolase II [Acetobacteraceae bacterium]|jgi:GTP cyclohydrolase II|nr:GTP cyclohydrolase II [Acetobacteraceae bacterium]